MVRHAVSVISMPAEERNRLSEEIVIHYLQKRTALACQYDQKEDIRRYYAELKEKTAPGKRYRRMVWRKLYPAYDLFCRAGRRVKRTLVRAGRKD